MYSYAVRHPVKRAKHYIKNFADGGHGGFTPLALASQLGMRAVFDEITELHRKEMWRFSNTECSLYPIHAVDSIDWDGRTSKLCRQTQHDTNVC